MGNADPQILAVSLSVNSWLPPNFESTKLESNPKSRVQDLPRGKSQSWIYNGNKKVNVFIQLQHLNLIILVGKPKSKYQHIVIPADHPENPAYYELRTGFPPPDNNFYREKRNGQLIALIYAHRKWVASLRMTTGQFYRPCQDVAVEIISSNIYTANWNDIGTKMNLYEIYFKIYTQFVEGVHLWIKQHNVLAGSTGSTGPITCWPRAAHWTQGPNWQTKKFNGLLQLQHLSVVIMVENPPGEDAVHAVEVPVSAITTRGKYSFTPVDIHVTEISLSRLVEEVMKKGHLLFNMQTHVFTYPGAEEETMVVDRDSELHTAVFFLRETLLKGIDLGVETNAIATEKRKRVGNGGPSQKKEHKRKAIRATTRSSNFSEHCFWRIRGMRACDSDIHCLL
ncbi:hypothetical protein OPT61_g256 [Boeremia exigua]|uniref:Uncharacterized protein n=1 Tax=Boeremia exigua TaxID=749465 RepID=A0ACC2IUW5_9PLEO|nr:hypothetical protein OPT61_g256 [Boeremia exigua]